MLNFRNADKASDIILRTLSEAMASKETEEWTGLQKSEIVDVCHMIINLIRRAETWANCKSEASVKSLNETLKYTFEVYGGAENISGVLLNILAVAMSGDGCDNVWEKEDRAASVHIMRHSINLLNASEAYVRDKKLVDFYWEVPV